MATYMRLRKKASLCSSLFNISQQRLYGSNYSSTVLKSSKTLLRNCFPFWLSLPCRNISSVAAAELPYLSPSTLSSPLLLLPPEEVTGHNSNNNHDREVNIPLFSLADNQVVSLPNRRLPEEIYHARCVGSSHGWLAFVNGRKCGFYLANLLSPSVSPEIIQLPPIETLNTVKRVVRDSSSNIVNEYHMYNNRAKLLYPRTPDHLSWLLINRFAMSSAPNNGNNNCTVMVSHSDVHDLAFCRIGDTSWTPLKNQFKSLFKEIIYSKKDQLFYALTYEGDVEAWDLQDPTSPKRIDMALECQDNNLSRDEEELRLKCSTEEYLVESSGGDILYIVRNYVFVAEDGTYVNPDDYPVENVKLPYRTTRFDIYKLEFEKETAKPLTSIGDRVLFLGYNHSFSLSSRDYPNLKPNSIYFADIHDNYLDYEDYYPYGGYDSGVYNLEDHSVTPLYHPFRFKNFLPAPIWVFPWQ